MSERSQAVFAIGQRTATLGERDKSTTFPFGDRVFGRNRIQQALPSKLAQNWLNAMDGQEKVNCEYLDRFAEVLKDWAVSQGATHYTHWFQPLTNKTAEKHDSFLSWKKGSGEVIEKLSGHEMLQGETDGSSLPSGHLRATSSACAHTIWDPTMPAFLWESSDGLTLCIPALLLTYRGEAIDHKIPLLRSEQKLGSALLRLIKLASIPAAFAYPTLGPEQEYFLVSRRLFDLRPDLMLCGRTVYGQRPPKAQQMADHYFSAMDQRFFAYARDVEETAFRLGIPVKSRHNEVAPNQHEMSPLFEKASVASDHNLQFMELMRQKAPFYEMACLFHEKPFAKVNGSGKHCNWSIATDSGLNLLDPKEKSLSFLVTLTAVLHAVHEHAALLSSSIGSYQNDYRLGGHEAPPAILSVYLGDALEEMIEKIIHCHQLNPEVRHSIDLGLNQMMAIQPAASDRNRTSFLAFNRNRFELRAVGSSQNVAWPIATLNTIVADSLQLIIDEIEDEKSRNKNEDLLAAAWPVLRKHLKSAEPVIFSGDNYTQEWQKEADGRGLPRHLSSYHALTVLRDAKTKRVFQGVLSPDELEGRLQVFFEQYAKWADIECNLMIEMFRTQILPAALEHQKHWAKSIDQIRKLDILASDQLKPLERFSEQISKAIIAIDALEEIQNGAQGLGWEAQGKLFSELVRPKMQNARQAVDALESVVADSLWPLPKYRELLFLL
ncbi:MAG: glnA [Parachlamydiales bacterium]|nr:glnA [Parachlamydiales bacterium]